MHIFKLETVPQITFILLLLLLEHSVVFISSSVNVISNLCLMFLNMILPFKWLHPFVSSIPHNALDILHSPVPFLGGIVLSQEEANNQLTELAQQHQNITFVQISEETLNILNLEYHQQIEQCSTFQILNGLIKQSICSNDNGKIAFNLIIQQVYSNRQIIFNCVNQFVRQKLAQRIKLTKLINSKIDVNDCRKQFLGQTQDYLLKELTRTQMFLDFLSE